MGKKFRRGRESAAGLANKFDAWFKSIVACLPRDDHSALLNALSNKPETGLAMWNVEIQMPPAISPFPVNLLRLAQILGAERCLRELSKRWSRLAPQKVARALAESMEEFEAGGDDAGRCMRAISDGMRDAELDEPRPPDLTVACCPSAPKATQALVAHVAARSLAGDVHLSGPAKVANTLLRRAELAIAEGDVDALCDALDELVRHCAADDTENLGEAWAASIVSCVIGCQRPEFVSIGQC